MGILIFLNLSLSKRHQELEIDLSLVIIFIQCILLISEMYNVKFPIYYTIKLIQKYKFKNSIDRHNSQ